jgi:hypothetical protein
VSVRQSGSSSVERRRVPSGNVREHERENERKRKKKMTMKRRTCRFVHLSGR